jgi:hypothetical protein
MLDKFKEAAKLVKEGVSEAVNEASDSIKDKVSTKFIVTSQQLEGAINLELSSEELCKFLTENTTYKVRIK